MRVQRGAAISRRFPDVVIGSWPRSRESLEPKKSLAVLNSENVSRANVQAYDYYVRGRQFFNQMRRKGLELARQMFARAVVIDPGYSRAYAGVGYCCSFLYLWCDASNDNLQEALSASRHAIELDPQSAEAHTARDLAETLRDNYEAANNEFETALQLDSQLFDAYYFYAKSCFLEGRCEKAAGLFARASQINPDDYQAPALRGMCFRALNSTKEACEASRDCLRNVERHLQLHPATPVPSPWDWARFIDLAITPGPLNGQIVSGPCTPRNRRLSTTPRVPTLLGERDRSIDCLGGALCRGYSHKVWIESDPSFSSRRGHPRFKALMGSL